MLSILWKLSRIYVVLKAVILENGPNHAIFPTNIWLSKFCFLSVFDIKLHLEKILGLLNLCEFLSDHFSRISIWKFKCWREIDWIHACQAHFHEMLALVLLLLFSSLVNELVFVTMQCHLKILCCKCFCYTLVQRFSPFYYYSSIDNTLLQILSTKKI